MNSIYFLMVLAAGAGLSFQAPINARLREYTGSPIAGAFVTFVLGTTLLGLVTLTLPQGSLSLDRLRTAPPWAFIGGAFGVTYVVSAMIAVPRLGTALLVATTVTGQMIAALIIDHYGWFGVGATPATPRRLFGGALLGLALYFMRK